MKCYFTVTNLDTDGPQLRADQLNIQWLETCLLHLTYSTPQSSLAALSAGDTHVSPQLGKVIERSPFETKVLSVSCHLLNTTLNVKIPTDGSMATLLHHREVKNPRSNQQTWGPSLPACGS